MTLACPVRALATRGKPPRGGRGQRSKDHPSRSALSLPAGILPLLDRRDRAAVAPSATGQAGGFDDKRKDVEKKYDAWVDRTASWLDGRQSELDGGGGGGDGSAPPPGGGGGGGGGEGGGGNAKKVFGLAWMTGWFSFMTITYAVNLWKTSGDFEAFDLVVSVVVGAILMWTAVRLFTGPITMDVYTTGILCSGGVAAANFLKAKADGWTIYPTIMTCYGFAMVMNFFEAMRVVGSMS